MAIVKSADVFCDGAGCPQWIHGSTGRGALSRRARRAVATAGWVHVGGRDLCPECWARRPNPACEECRGLGHLCSECVGELADVGEGS